MRRIHFINENLKEVEIQAKVNARQAIRQRADVFEANISANKITFLRARAQALRKANVSVNIQPFAVLPALHSVLFSFPLEVTSGISISTLEIRQERSSRFYLRVKWTSAFEDFYCLYMTTATTLLTSLTFQYQNNQYKRSCLCLKKG